MKMQKMFRGSLLLWGMAFVLWITVIPAKAEQMEMMGDQFAETKLQDEEIIQIEDITGLDAEFQALEEESVLIVEEVEQYRRQAQRKKIQRIVVIMLVIAIFGVGIVTGLQEKRKKESVLTDKEKGEEQKVKGGKT